MSLHDPKQELHAKALRSAAVHCDCKTDLAVRLISVTVTLLLFALSASLQAYCPSSKLNVPVQASSTGC
jgi:hypothetical protein